MNGALPVDTTMGAALGEHGRVTQNSAHQSNCVIAGRLSKPTGFINARYGRRKLRVVSTMYALSLRVSPSA